MEFCRGRVVVTIDTQATCLVIYPLPEWERFEQQVQALPAMKQAIRRFQRLILGYACDLELDGNGRMLLPQSLREYAQLDKKLVLVGQGNKLELWSEELWLAERDKALAESSGDAELPEELMSLIL
jgi:MraZ protein